MKPSEPVCLSLCSLFVFLKKNKFYTKCTYVCEPLPKTRALWFLGGWRGLMVYCAEQFKKKKPTKKQSIFVAMSFCLGQHRLSLCSQRLTLWWKQLKAASFNHCGLLSFFKKIAIDWSISGYTGISWCFFCFLFFFLSSWLLIWSFEFPDGVL